MIAALIATNLITVAAAALFVRSLLESQRQREDQLLNRIQAPQVAVSQSLPDTPQPYLAAFDEEGLAAYEDLRRQMTVPEGAE